MKSARKNKAKIFGICCTILFGAFSSVTLSFLLQNVFKLSLKSSVSLSIVVNVLFSALILFHKASRCVFFLMIPQFLSKKGRSALVAYSFYVALTGPVVNLMHNANVLSESLTCGQVRW